MATFSSMLDLVYPKGSIFQTMNADTNPSTDLGGQWSSIDGYFLQSVNKTTATADIALGNNAVTLVTNNLPHHCHFIAGAYTTTDGQDLQTDYLLYSRWNIAGTGWFRQWSGNGEDSSLPSDENCLSKPFSIIPRSKTVYGYNRTS